MTLSYVWAAFFLVGIIVALIRTFVKMQIVDGVPVFETVFQPQIFSDLVNGLIKTSGTAIELAIGIVGVMILFLGLLKIGEKAGLIESLSKAVSPFFSVIFPEIPKNHPAIGHIMMNFSANLLGLDNAATPFGLKAMESLQELNPKKDTASNSQIMFTTLLAAGLTFVPVSVIAYRASAGAKDPTDVFLPILFATTVAALSAIFIVGIRQRLNFFKPAFIYGLLGIIAFYSLLVALIFYVIPQPQIEGFTQFFSSGIILLIIATFLFIALRRKVNVFETFIEGGKEGWSMAVRVMPYLVAMLAAISVLRNSGVLDFINSGIAFLVESCGGDTRFVDALPTALMKPLSGSGARGMMIETMNTFGADSFAGRLASVFQGTTDTTFYIMALYFGSVGISKTRYTLTSCLLAELCGIIAATVLVYIYYSLGIWVDK